MINGHYLLNALPVIDTLKLYMNMPAFILCMKHKIVEAKKQTDRWGFVTRP